MKKKAITMVAILILLLTACAPQATPTMNAVDVQHTAEAAAFTMVAQTQGAIPTNTLVPPTELPTETPLPTLTSIASPTAISDSLTIATATSIDIPTLAPLPTATTESTGNCNKPLTSWKVPTATFNTVNETKPQGKITLSLYVVTEFGECGYLTDLSRGPAGSYSAGAFVDGKKSFKVFGGFLITEGPWDIVVKNDKIVAVAACHPHC